MITCRAKGLVLRILTAAVLASFPSTATASEPETQEVSKTPESKTEEPKKPEPKKSFRNGLFLSFAVPLTGGFNISWSRPVSDRLVLSSFIAYFDRNWLLIIEPSDWHSYSGYIGVMLQYYPATPLEGYFIGGDLGLAISYQTYLATHESGIFFFPFIDLYLVGYSFRLWRGLFLDVLLGGGYAPVQPIVIVKGHKHDGGDFYPIADLRIGYRW